MVFMGRTNINDTDGLLQSFQAFCFSKKKSKLTIVKTRLCKNNKLTSYMFRPSRGSSSGRYLKHIRKYIDQPEDDS
jgi:hypothetical protein